MTHRLHQDDPYLLEFDASVVQRLVHEGRPALVLDRSAFFAASGGQSWDTGTLNGIPVEAVLLAEDRTRVLHVLAAQLLADSMHGRIDEQTPALQDALERTDGGGDVVQGGDRNPARLEDAVACAVTRLREPTRSRE